MSDLNSIVSAHSHLKLVDSGEINSRGQIVGLAIQRTTGEFLAFLATPCDEHHPETAGCADDATSDSGAQDTTSVRPDLIRTETIRNLHRRLMNHRLIHIPGRTSPAE